MKEGRHTFGAGMPQQPQSKAVYGGFFGPTVGRGRILVKASADKLVDKIRETCSVEEGTVLLVVLREESERSPEGSEDVLVIDVAASDAADGGEVCGQLVGEVTGIVGTDAESPCRGRMIEGCTKETCIEIVIVTEVEDGVYAFACLEEGNDGCGGGEKIECDVLEDLVWKVGEGHFGEEGRLGRRRELYV